jgi:hypothetical protein
MITRQLVFGLVVGIAVTTVFFLFLGADRYELYHFGTSNMLKLNKRTGEVWAFSEKGWSKLD